MYRIERSSSEDTFDEPVVPDFFQLPYKMIEYNSKPHRIIPTDQQGHEILDPGMFIGERVQPGR